jgi:CubicO group peptidase (beta-lactamase class C family)
MAICDPLGSALQAAVEEGVFPGAVLAVRHRGSLVYEQAVGRLSFAPSAAPTIPQTVYDLASLTKPLATTTAILLLAQQRRLTIGSRVDDWLDPFRGSPLGEASLLHLLTHSSGLPGWRAFYERLSADPALEYQIRDRKRVQARVLEYIKEESLLFPSGARSLYSDLGFMLLGMIVERITGQSLADFCEKALFAPLEAGPLAYRAIGSNATTDNPVYPIAPTEEDPWRGRIVCGEVHDENAYAMGGIAGHAGLFGTARAVLTVSSAWLAAYHGRDSFLDRTLVQRFTARQQFIPHSSWAIGWDTPSASSSSGKYFSPASFGHLGYTGTSLWIDPSQDLEVVLLSNRVHPTRRNERIRRFRPQIHDLVYQELI